ncbi:MAG: DinB family protein [Gemmatimonadales bacterium]
MTTLPPARIVRQLRDVLHEAFEGSPHPWTYFTDNGPAGTPGGIFGAIDGIDADRASRPVGPSGSTIAGHVHHLAFSAEASTAWIRGDRSPRDWNESWRVTTVSPEDWAALMQELRRQYDELQAAIEDAALDGEEAFGGAVGVVAHAAYHLAHIRQKVSETR